MNKSLSSEEIVTLTRQIAALYVQEAPEQTFGEWVLTRFYAEANTFDLANARDFAGAERTFDGRMYLSGMLRTGSLSAAPLLRAVEESDITDTALSMII